MEDPEMKLNPWNPFKRAKFRIHYLWSKCTCKKNCEGVAEKFKNNIEYINN